RHQQYSPLTLNPTFEPLLNLADIETVNAGLGHHCVEQPAQLRHVAQNRVPDNGRLVHVTATSAAWRARTRNFGIASGSSASSGTAAGMIPGEDTKGNGSQSRDSVRVIVFNKSRSNAGASSNRCPPSRFIGNALRWNIAAGFSGDANPAEGAAGSHCLP